MEVDGLAVGCNEEVLASNSRRKSGLSRMLDKRSRPYLRSLTLCAWKEALTLARLWSSDIGRFVRSLSAQNSRIHKRVQRF